MIATEADLSTTILAESNLENTSFIKQQSPAIPTTPVLEISTDKWNLIPQELTNFNILTPNNQLNSATNADINLNSQTTQQRDLLNGSSAGVVNIEANLNNNLATGKNNVSAPILVNSTLDPNQRQLSKNFVSYNVVSTNIPDWNSQQLANKIDIIAGDRLLRLPGGTVSNYWDWKRGGIIADTSNLAGELPNFLQFDARSYNKGTLDNFNSLTSLTNTTPVWVLNMLTSTLEEQLQMLRTAKQKGMSVEYIELGNEFYFPIADHTQAFRLPSDYAREANVWIDAIKKEFPQAKISVVGAIPDIGKTGNRIETWNQALVNGKTIDRADAITLHFYINNGLSSAIDPNQTYPYFKANEVATILGEPFRKWEELRNTPQYQLIPQNRAIWVTEYNVIERNDPKNIPEQRIEGSWAHAMFVTAMGLQFLEDPRIEFTNLHSLFGTSQFSAIFPNNSSFRNPDRPDMNSATYGLSGIGEAFRLFGKTTENMDKARAINFTNSPTLTTQDGFNYSALYGMKFTSQLGVQRALIMNLSDKPIQIDANSIGFQNAKYDQIYSNPRTLVNNYNSLDRLQGNSQGVVTLQPYSITKLSG